VFGVDGNFEKEVTPNIVQNLIIQGLQTPNYKGIKCSALAIYAKQFSAIGFFPFYYSLDAENKKRADTSFVSFVNFTNKQIELFKKTVKMHTVREIDGAHHYVFISNPDETVRFIRDFLK
jgi:hypothetical protein